MAEYYVGVDGGVKKLQLGLDGNKKEIYLTQKDRALSHMHVVGSTRTGCAINQHIGDFRET